MCALFGRDLSAVAKRAHQTGVREAVAFLEGGIGLRRGRHGTVRVMPQGLVAIGFDHCASRAGDPLLHMDAISMNRALGPDGRWTALGGHDPFRDRKALLMAANAIYRAAYQTHARTGGRERVERAQRRRHSEIRGMREKLIL